MLKKELNENLKIINQKNNNEIWIKKAVFVWLLTKSLSMYLFVLLNKKRNEIQIRKYAVTAFAFIFGSIVFSSIKNF